MEPRDTVASRRLFVWNCIETYLIVLFYFTFFMTTLGCLIIYEAQIKREGGVSEIKMLTRNGISMIKRQVRLGTRIIKVTKRR